MVDPTLVNEVPVAGDPTVYDAACKQLLNDRVILAHVLKSCASEYAHCPVEEVAWDLIEDEGPQRRVSVNRAVPASAAIRGARNEDTSPGEGTVLYDLLVRVLLPDGEGVGSGPGDMLVNIEAQTNFYPGYPLMERAQYYCARVLSAQYGTDFSGSHYEMLRGVYSIWVCLNPPKALAGVVMRWPVAGVSRAGKGEPASYDWGRDLMRVVMICVGAPGSPGIAGLLGTLFSAALDPERKMELLAGMYHVNLTDDVKEEVSGMALGEFAKAAIMEGLEMGFERGETAGFERGMACGVKQGIEQGREEGREGASVECARNLMGSLGMTPEQALDALGVDGSCRMRCLELLGA